MKPVCINLRNVGNTFYAFCIVMETCDCNKISKLSTKVRKKLSRARAKLVKEDFEFSETPTPYLVISNGGIANGVRRGDLELLLDGFITLVTSSLKSYAVVSFEGSDATEKIVEKLQGHVMDSEYNLASTAPTLYLHYLKSFEEWKDAREFASTDFHDVPGLILSENFISEEEGRNLIQFLERENPVVTRADEAPIHLKHRQVWHYGYEFRYKYNDVNTKKPLENGVPQILEAIVSKMIDARHIQRHPNQITVNKYEPGQGIPPHIDNPEAFDEILVSLSLFSQTVMDFKHPETGSHVQVLLQPRSLVVFTGESRYKWTHGICPRKVDLLPTDNEDRDCNLTPVNRRTRYSVTFRRVKGDYKGPGPRQSVIDPVASQPTSDLEAASLEELHVHKVYDEIASHFTVTRDKPWPRVKQFIDNLEANSLVLDVGCGSGRYLGVRKDIQMVGCDRSENLIGICKEKGFEVFTCDGLDLPVREGIFDACICIAVIHHYSTLERRLKSIEQLLKLMKIGGKVLISVWALEQEYKRVKSKYLKRIGDNSEDDLSIKPSEEAIGAPSNSEKPLPEKSSTTKEEESTEESLNCLPVHKNRTPFHQQDVLVPWHKKNVSGDRAELSPKTEIVENRNSAKEMETFHRYYHVFKKGELVEICEKNGETKLLNSYYDEGNWCVILEKL